LGTTGAGAPDRGSRPVSPVDGIGARPSRCDELIREIEPPSGRKKPPKSIAKGPLSATRHL
jgi:hypothetical protein